MECPNQVLKRLITGRCKKFDLFGFRFGPMTTVSIEVVYHSCGKFSSHVVDGPHVKDFETIFFDEIERGKQDIVRELAFLVRRKNIIKEINEKKTYRDNRKLEELKRASFDELTTRMRLMRQELPAHECKIKNPNVIIYDKDIDSEVDKFYTDTTKIINKPNG